MHNIEPFKTAKRIPFEQDADPVLANLKRQMLGLPFDDQVPAINPRHTHYCWNEKRIIVKNITLHRKNYNSTRNINNQQVLLPVQLGKYY